MTLPATLTICESAAAADGGTVDLSATDENGKEHSVLLVQHVFAEWDTTLHAIPGRLYFDGELVDVRSTAEGALLELLRNAEVRLKEEERSAPHERVSTYVLVHGDDVERVADRSPEQNVRATVQAIIDYVASVEYVAFAAIMDEMRK